MPVELRPELSIVPIVRAQKDMPVRELLGTGFFVGMAPKLRLVTAKHVVEDCQLADGDRIAIAFRTDKGISIVAVSRFIGSPDFDIAVGEIETSLIPTAVGLTLSRHDPALNGDVFTYEYSGTRIEKTTPTHTLVSFEPYTHKGNIVRSYESTFPEKVKTPCFLMSFPALQGASGAPLLSGTASKKSIAVVGMTVGNVEKHLLPAQVVTIRDGKDFEESISYFLPFGRALARSLLATELEKLGVEFRYAEDSE